jgi:hypothetical protein
MKKIVISLMTSLMFILSSCSNSDENVLLKDENIPEKNESMNGLVVLTRTFDPTITDSSDPNHPNHPDYWPTKPPVSTGGGELPPYEGTFSPENIAFGADDIKSLNVTTREIVFANSTIANDLDKRVFGLSIKLGFYLGESPLLTADVASPIASFFYDDLVFVKEDSKFYLLDGYPRGSWDEIPGKREQTDATREANAQKRKLEWDTFVQYLSDEGKIVR